MARKDGTEDPMASPATKRRPSRLLLWIAATALTLIGIALFVVGFYRQGLLGAVFYLVVVAMGVYLFTIPWRNRRAQAKTGHSDGA
jgi:membrane protein YdbS with pleckstrin-like domain